jgi:hypothetical protein
MIATTYTLQGAKDKLDDLIEASRDAALTPNLTKHMCRIYKERMDAFQIARRVLENTVTVDDLSELKDEDD